MDRKNFIKNGILGVGGTIVGLSIIESCAILNSELVIDETDCADSPTEIAGPFPNKTPMDFVRENIVGDRTGVPLLIKIKVENTKLNCLPLEDVYVDIWHCDSKGDYSEYNKQLNGDFTNKHFLRGRQTTDENGMVSFITIYPGWYPGRAPHLHFEVKTKSGKSLLITQTALPEDVTKAVYKMKEYNGINDTSNVADFFFGSSLNRNLVNKTFGNVTDGYTMVEVLKVTL